MKKEKSEFPWYLIYTPVFTIVVMQWCSDIVLGDDSVDILEKFLEWIGLGKDSVLTIVLIAVSIIAVCYVISRLVSANKDLKKIGGIAETAPEKLSNQMSGVERNICNKLNENDKQYSRDLIEIKNSTRAVQRQVEIINLHRNDVPIQQKDMQLFISQLYSRIGELEERNLQLEAQCADLKKELQKVSHLDISHEQDFDRDDWCPSL